jgi:hypothetical protein
MTMGRVAAVMSKKVQLASLAPPPGPGGAARGGLYTEYTGVGYYCVSPAAAPAIGNSICTFLSGPEPTSKVVGPLTASREQSAWLHWGQCTVAPPTHTNRVSVTPSCQSSLLSITLWNPVRQKSRVPLYCSGFLPVRLFSFSSLPPSIYYVSLLLFVFFIIYISSSHPSFPTISSHFFSWSRVLTLLSFLLHLPLSYLLFSPSPFLFSS